jgi:glycosyltransferase involved in cell wall biosynthesis
MRRATVPAPMHANPTKAPGPRDALPARMRILHAVCHSHRRGSEMAALELAGELERLGHRNRLVAMGPALDGCQEPDLPSLGRSWREGPTQLVTLAFRLRRLLAREPVDVVLAHGSWPAGVVALAAPRHGPLLVWQRILGFPDTVWGPLRRRWWGTVARRMDAGVALTPDQGDELRRLGFRGPVWVIPNFRRPERFLAVDRDVAGARLRAEIGVPDGTPVVGFVGHLVSQKRADRALDVLSRLRADGREVHMVVVGDGALRGDLEARAERLDVADAVTFLGHRDDVEWVLGGVDLAVLTSDTETMPGVSIEALMAGCPMVTVPVVGVDQVVEHSVTGLVVDGFEPPEITDALSGLLDDDDARRAMSRASRARAERFSARTAAAVYAERLTAALDGR